MKGSRGGYAEHASRGYSVHDNTEVVVSPVGRQRLSSAASNSSSLMSGGRGGGDDHNMMIPSKYKVYEHPQYKVCVAGLPHIDHISNKGLFRKVMNL